MTMKYDMEKFDRSASFTLWQVKMRALLTHQGLHKVLLGKEKMPQDLTQEDAEDMDLKALSAIQLCLSNEVLQEVLEETKAAGLWLKLESLYMTKSLSNKLYLKQRLYLLRMSEGTSIKSHLDEFNSILNDLKRMVDKIDDEDMAILLLCSLPPSYKNFRESFIIGREELNLEDVKAALLSKELLEKQTGDSEGTSSHDIAFLASENSVRDGGGKAKHKNLTCNYCHKKGHIKADCLKLKNKKQFEESSANTAVGTESGEALYVIGDSLLDESEFRSSVEGGVLEMSIGAHDFAKAMRLKRSDIYLLQDPSATAAVQETFESTRSLLGCVEEACCKSPSVFQGTTVLAEDREASGIHIKSLLEGTTVMTSMGTSKIGEFLPLHKSRICLGLFDILDP
jgi:hypothetical protein